MKKGLTTGLATLQRGSSAGLAGLQPGSSFSTTNNSRYATLQRGSSTGYAGLQPGSSEQAAGLEPGEPTEAAANTPAGLEPGEPSGAAANTVAKLELGEPSGASPGGNEMIWTDRGYMPHVDGQQLIQHVSYHLADSLPKEALQQMAAELKSLPPKLRDAEKEKSIAQYLDAGKGSCVLREPVVAEMVQNAFLLFHNERYVLHEWCVMPNHVHVLFQPINGWSMSKIVSSWKSFTGRRISEYGKTAGLEPGEPSRVWHREYWDRYIRDHAHYVNVVNYIRMNPVKAGLVGRPEEWKFSSAGYSAGLAGLQPGNTNTAGLEPGSTNTAGLEPGEPSK